MDIAPMFKPIVIGDNRKMVGVGYIAFWIVTYDLPLACPLGKYKSTEKIDDEFGAPVPCGGEEDWSLRYLCTPFLGQARLMLKPSGLLLLRSPI